MADKRNPDGVRTYLPDAHDRQLIQRTQQALAQFPAPVLVSRNNPHERLYIAAFDGTGNDRNNPDMGPKTNVALIHEQVLKLKKSGSPARLHACVQLSNFGVIKTNAVFLVFALVACQQAVPSAMPPPSLQEPTARTTSASEVAPTASAPATDWKLSVSPGESGTYRIHIAGADGRELQVIEGQDGMPPYEASVLLKIEDFTGDGKPDILARGLSAGASALTSERIYVYDAKSGRFLDAELFENDGEITKTGPGCIAVEHRNPDNMTYSKDQYCWEGKWVFKGSKD